MKKPKDSNRVSLESIKDQDSKVFKNLHISIDIRDFGDSRLNVNGKSFIDCIFYFNQNCSLNSYNSNFESCVFYGGKDISSLNKIRIYHTSKDTSLFKSNSIMGFYDFIEFEQINLVDLMDASNSNNMTLKKCTVLNSGISGATKYYSAYECFFNTEPLTKKHSQFNKYIIVKAIFEDVIFHRYRINPYYIAVKCQDKSSLDISGAELIDNWSMLRKEYSGLRLAIILILTLLFFTPYITKFLLLIGAAKIDQTQEIESIPLWDAFFFNGDHGLLAITFFIFTIILLIYNIGRFTITIRISKLKEEESFLYESGFNLASLSPHKYERLLKWHRILRILFWISLLFSTFKFIETLFIQVPFF